MIELRGSRVGYWRTWLCLLAWLVLGCSPRLPRSADEPSEAAPPSQDAAVCTGERVRLADWRLGFRLPSEDWRGTGSFEQDGKSIYQFARLALEDSLGRSITPGITVACEHVDSDWDVIEYSARLRSGQRVAWHIDDVLTHEDGALSLTCAIAYLIHYVDNRRNEHTACVVHAKRGTVGIQIIADVTTELYPMVRGEWKAFLRSLILTP